MNCNEDDEDSDSLDFQHSTIVRVSPEELMFYGEFSRNDELQESVLVKNLTLTSVMITAVYVVGDNSLYGVGAEDYFHTDWEHGPDNFLGPGDTLEIIVRFQPSQELRSGGLIIETTHIDFGILDVELSGKFFATE